MTMNTDLFSELQEFIVNKGGVDYAEVTRDAKLEEDLGIYGDDAIELLVAYGKKFSVNISNFKAADYFSPEGDIILPALFRMITGKKKKKTKYLTIEHLEKGILAGTLDEHVINK
jgi:acyl carrier protein